jgi:two-component system phosphate regulon sensor histidine kinase PhoR
MDDTLSSVIIESMSNGVVVLDFQGHITHINPAGLEILGLKFEETRDRTYAELFMGKPENDEFNDILLSGIQDKETRLHKEVAFRRNDGQLIDLAVTTSFLRLESGKWKDEGIVVVFRDITEVKALDRARHRVLDHLSHELRTPLSIVLASLKRVETPENQKPVERIKRNLKRLQDIQADVEDIIRQKDFEGDHNPRPRLEQTLDLVELLVEDNPVHAHTLSALKDMLEKLFPHRTTNVQKLSIGSSIEGMTAVINELSSHRDVRLIIDAKEDQYVLIDKDAFEKILKSLVKNAIENTPDGGMVLVSLGASSDTVEMMVKDTGVGITRESQAQIFGGFYHAKETDLYSTKRPFDFDAGGKGLELLRLKIFEEIYRFRTECKSTRCKHIPGESDSCPGVISKCPYVQDEEQCARSGGTAFKLMFRGAKDPNA